MEFNKEELQDWIIENHDKYYETNFDIQDMFPIDCKFGKLVQHADEKYFVRIFWLDISRYTDYWDYPIEDYKIWLRDRKINKILQ